MVHAFSYSSKQMIKQLHKLLLLAAAFLFVANSYGQEVEIEIDGICYKFDRRGSTASVSDYKEGESDIIIPASLIIIRNI